MNISKYALNKPIFGVDISEFQGGIDLAKVKKEGAKFVILRAGYTSSKDGKTKKKDAWFERFYTAAQELNIPVGAY